MTLRLLSSGVDSLYLSVNGGVRTALLAELEAAKARAQHERGPVPIEFAETGWRLLLKPNGSGGYAYWLTSAEVELWAGRNAEMAGPRARVQLHSVYLHAVGPVAALAAVRVLLERCVCAGPLMLSVSRLDVYADVQGLRLVPADEPRFVTRANDRQVRIDGRRFTGFRFGSRRGAVLARLYDKDVQMAKEGLTWMSSYWRGRVEGEPVWRLEFELRREFLRRLEAQDPEALLERVPALWAYCTGEWLTLRTATAQEESWRWPLDPVWVEAQGLHGGVQEGRELVWRAVEAADEERVLAVLGGSFTTWSAMRGIEDQDRAGRAMVLRVDRYLAKTDRTFKSEVRRKRELLRTRGVRRAVLGRRVHLAVPDDASGGPKAQEEEIVTSDRPFGADGPEGTRGRQSTALGRPKVGPGEAAGGHEHGHEEYEDGRGDDGCRTAAVGVEPPTQPGGHEPNRFEGGRVGTARKRGAGRRGGAVGRGRSESGRRRGSQRSVSSEGSDRAGVP